MEMMAPMNSCPGKKSWPELMGIDGVKAGTTIEKENKNVTAVIVIEGTPVPSDFRCDRVWVWVNKQWLVSIVPILG
ncbi:hypothetical protein LIER_41697 [Lithospermum erythrorhizon]|uniref:Uncharacterized protein n=1 Tax=Lithospermum erythrorhizon TaxID=34254 RepID=A0AAV3RD37_LITER